MAKEPEVSIEEALARSELERIELIRGTLVAKASRSGEHSEVLTHIDRRVGVRFDRKPGGRWPGGWWIRTASNVQLVDELFSPDLAGWRRERQVIRAEPFDAIELRVNELFGDDPEDD